MPAFQVNFGANDLNCVDVPLNPTHSLSWNGTCWRRWFGTTILALVVSATALIVAAISMLDISALCCACYYVQ